MGRGTDESFRDLLGLQEKMCRLFDDHVSHGPSPREPVSSHWSPPVDIYETSDEFVLVAEIPGVSQEDIDLELSDDLLVLRGERPTVTGDPAHSYHRIERPNGIFQRAFRLPAEVDASDVQAVYREGVLWVTLRKRETARARSVAVRVED
jgi:HSP20 family protein